MRNLTHIDLSKIKALVFDVDGVFTDGGILCDTKGEFYRTFDSKDGFAIRMASLKNYHLGIITGGRSISIRERFRACGMVEEDVYLGSRDKKEDLMRFCERHKLDFSEVLYVGDDLPDLEVLQVVGLSACPADAVPEVREAVDFISSYPGGKGCVREIVECLLKEHNNWSFDTPAYKAKF